MTDNERIAGVLAAGMLYPVLPPATGPDGAIEQDEQTRFVRDVFHAVALYRAVLEALGQTDLRRVRLGAGTFAPAEFGDPAVANFARPTDAPAPAATSLADARGGY
jgi:hypothetical protein